MLLPLRAVALLVLTSCGYQLVGSRPFGREHIAVSVFGELEPIGIAPDVTRELSLQLGRGGTRVATTRGAADAELRGRIRSARSSPIAIADPAAPIVAYQVVLDLDAELIDPGGATLWSTRLTLAEDYLPTRDADPSARTLATEAQRRKALLRLAQRAAREIYDQLLFHGTDGAHPSSRADGRT